MNFLSDTTAPVHPAVMEAMAAVNHGHAASYGDDDVRRRAEAALGELFETELSVWFTTSGTAANALALSVICPSHGSVICHREAHIQCDERGAPEFFTGGAKLALLDGEHARITPETLAARLGSEDRDHVHETPSAALSISNLTECGAAYAAHEVAALADLAHEHGLLVHMDGARLANALVYKGASPAETTWRAGVDVLSFGMTKNGAMGCEAIILFGDAKERYGELLIRAKRAGHMPPKQRYIAAQMLAMLEQDLWLNSARAANECAAALAEAFTKVEGARLLHPVEGNELFVELPDDAAARLRAAGAEFYAWPFGGYRFVCSWCTPFEDVQKLIRSLNL